jgi:hypothetical protein
MRMRMEMKGTNGGDEVEAGVEVPSFELDVRLKLIAQSK